jgi:hypothetical protein
MHVIAGPDWPGGKPDNLTVLVNRFARPDRAKGDLVARRDLALASHRDANIISRVQYQQVGLS